MFQGWRWSLQNSMGSFDYYRLCMKTQFEKRYKYSLDRIVFGNPKKKVRWFYFVLLVLIVIFGLIL